MKTDLSKFNNSWYKPGRNSFVRFLWIVTSACWVNSWWPFSGCKKFCLRLFGAKIGKGVVIKPHVNIKYPWRLKIGDHVWIGEYVWIDNLGDVEIESNVCISQGALLLCGNHNYKKETFDLIVGNIHLKEGCWIGAKSIVGPGVTVGSNSVLTVASVATSALEPFKIYRGNPAIAIKDKF
ncbi:MAG: colanic acid biosynthesis acetyltransferase WcaF [Bacteroidia bacterium]|nr:colanic acid biosynthesis acetyltransferase WcaF [Bacteroidia bacterium]